MKIYLYMLLFLLLFISCQSTENKKSVISNDLSRWVTVDNMKIHYYDTAPAEKTELTLVFIHGFNGCVYSFLSLIEQIPPKYQAVAVDLPGFGLSNKPEIDYTVGFYVDFLQNFLDELDIDQCVLVAHSFGGKVACHYAYNHPHRVTKMVLFSPNGLKGEEGALLFLVENPWIADIAINLNCELFTTIGIYDNFKHNPQLVDQTMIDSLVEYSLTPEGRKAISSVTKNAIAQDSVDSFLSQIKMPVLLVWGREDAIHQLEWAYTFQALLPNSRLEIIDNCGHIVIMEAVARSCELLMDFIG